MCTTREGRSNYCPRMTTAISTSSERDDALREIPKRAETD